MNKIYSIRPAPPAPPARPIAPPLPSIFVSNRNELWHAMISHKLINIRLAGGRVYMHAFVKGIALEDGSGYSFNVTIAYMSNGIHHNTTVYMRLPA